MLEGDEIKHTDMKRRSGIEYFRPVRKILKSKLIGGNMVQAINCGAGTVVRYTAEIAQWAKEETEYG